MKRSDILSAAKCAVSRQRNETYGEPEDNFARIAAKWSVTLGVDVTPFQVALCMIDLKTCRLMHDPTNADGWCDLAGYAACGGEVAAADAPDPCDCMGSLE